MKPPALNPITASRSHHRLHERRPIDWRVRQLTGAASSNNDEKAISPPRDAEIVAVTPSQFREHSLTEKPTFRRRRCLTREERG
ncbi:hypothetical protein TIFTF001_053975 [Ficus carica]|uniref:Uncharacterized protein n=1 Tax=Ficus carica TaxID=3494 RepID=A0AA88JJQ9_FICCA|nr:hypothetical protein TIFTF001_053975 [Ficus carica]